MATDDAIPPLRELRLANFKSVAFQRIPLSQLTILVGSNSSGKSNIIRGLLALAQTIEERSSVAGFLLNGSRVNLEEFNEVCNQRADPREVSIGVTAVVDGSQWSTYPSEFGFVRPFGDATAEVALDVSFSGDDPNEPIFSPVSKIGYSVHSGSTKGVRVALRRENPDDTPVPPESILWPDWYWQGPAKVITSVRGVLTGEDGRPRRVSGVDLRGLLPATLVRNQTANEAYAEAWITLAKMLGVHARKTRASMSDEKIASSAAAMIDSWFSAHKDEPSGFQEFMMEELHSSKGDQDLVSAAAATKDPDALAVLIGRSSHCKGRVVAAVRGGELAKVRAGSGGIYSLFARHLWHLGGLRVGPLPVYPGSPQVQAGDVGAEGQFVAAALHTHRERMIDVPIDESGATKRMNLTAGVEYWGSRLGLFEKVTPHYRGSLGLGMGIIQSGLDHELGTPSVGIGVTQLLPVVVRCLLADRGDVILLEQPELHLHPASQQRLGNFLLACARSGRQLIVETHSEHLINRLRLLAAKDNSPDGDVVQMVGVILAERDRETGTTTYRATRLNRLGGFDAWPAGFFEPGIDEAQELLEVALAKLRNDSELTRET